jgi:hypothetical protein
MPERHRSRVSGLCPGGVGDSRVRSSSGRVRDGLREHGARVRDRRLGRSQIEPTQPRANPLHLRRRRAGANRASCAPCHTRSGPHFPAVHRAICRVSPWSPPCCKIGGISLPVNWYPLGFSPVVHAGASTSADPGLDRNGPMTESFIRMMLERLLHTIVDKLKVCKPRTVCAWICANWLAGTSPACVGKRA